MAHESETGFTIFFFLMNIFLHTCRWSAWSAGFAPPNNTTTHPFLWMRLDAFPRARQAAEAAQALSGQAETRFRGFGWDEEEVIAGPLVWARKNCWGTPPQVVFVFPLGVSFEISFSGRVTMTLLDERDSHCAYRPSSETTATGTGLGESAGKPVAE